MLAQGTKPLKRLKILATGRTASESTIGEGRERFVRKVEALSAAATTGETKYAYLRCGACGRAAPLLEKWKDGARLRMDFGGGILVNMACRSCLTRFEAGAGSQRVEEPEFALQELNE